MRPVIFFGNLIQNILGFYPLAGTNKTFVAAYGNNPFTNGLFVEELGKLWIKESGIFILNFHLVGLVIGGKSMLSIELGWISKQIPVMFQKVVIRTLIGHTVDGITQDQPDGRGGEFRTALCFILCADKVCRLQQGTGFPKGAVDFQHNFSFFLDGYKKADGAFIFSTPCCYTLG